MKIRLMIISDYEAVYSLWSNSSEMGLRSLDDSFDGIARFLKRNLTTNFVAEVNNAIVGVILCGNDGRRGYIYHTIVKFNCRKQGIGKALVEAAINALKEELINKVALVVFSNNDLGNTFWKSVGFTKRDDLIYRNMSI